MHVSVQRLFLPSDIKYAAEDARARSDNGVQRRRQREALLRYARRPRHWLTSPNERMNHILYIYVVDVALNRLSCATYSSASDPR